MDGRGGKAVMEDKNRFRTSCDVDECLHWSNGTTDVVFVFGDSNKSESFFSTTFLFFELIDDVVLHVLSALSTDESDNCRSLL